MRRALSCFEDALGLLDPRLHAEQWSECKANLDRVIGALSPTGAGADRIEHFSYLVRDTTPAEAQKLLRFRIRSYLELPEPHRSRSLTALDRAIVSLESEAVPRVTVLWMGVLMEQPHEHLAVALRCRQAVNGELEGEAHQAALRAMERALGELEVIQRVRVRDMLTELGYERPEPT